MGTRVLSTREYLTIQSVGDPPRLQEDRERWNSQRFGVRLDRFDHEVDLAPAVGFARNAVGHSGRDELGLGDIIEPTNALRVEVPEQDRRARRIVRPRTA